MVEEESAHVEGELKLGREGASLKWGMGGNVVTGEVGGLVNFSSRRTTTGGGTHPLSRNTEVRLST